MISDKDREEFKAIVKKVINNEKYRSMRNLKHHRFTSCYEHSINVAMKCYIYAKNNDMNVDIASLVRGALLHDFYLYDWLHAARGKWNHCYTHPRIALENAIKEFGDLNEIEKDVIVSHMWPLNFFQFPKYKESFLVCFCDKLCATKELFGKKTWSNRNR